METMYKCKRNERAEMDIRRVKERGDWGKKSGRRRGKV